LATNRRPIGTAAGLPAASAAAGVVFARVETDMLIYS
jgi:hypothetical protein